MNHLVQQTFASPLSILALAFAQTSGTFPIRMLMDLFKEEYGMGPHLVSI
jgi:hypothetical protein